MWTQIIDKHFTGTFHYPSINQPADGIQLDNIDGIEIGNWAVINPFSFLCNIVKIVGITSNYIILESTPPTGIPVNSSVFIQTSPNWDILLFGAKISNPTNNNSNLNTKAINAAAFDCHKNNGGIVSIPKGEYELERLSNAPCCVNLSSFSNVKFVGEGMGVSILKLKSGDYGWKDTHMFLCYDSHGIEWHNLTLDGNKLELNTYANALGNKGQFHLINASLKCEEFFIDSVAFINAEQDGVKINDSNNFHINNSIFNFCGRNGITGQKISGNIWIKGCYFYFTKNSDIDMEPTFNPDNPLDDNPSPNKWIISDNIFERNPEGGNFLALSLSGIGVSTEDENFVVSNNIFQFGGINITNCRNVTVSGNILVGGIGLNALAPFWGQYLCEKFIFSNNYVVNNATIESGGNSSHLKCLYLFGSNGFGISDMLICNNTFERGGCQFQNCSGITFSQNKVNKARMEYEEDCIGLKIQLTVDSKEVFGKPDYGNYQITDNQIAGVYEAGLKITSKNSGYRFNQLHIDHNSIIGEGLQYGIWITQPAIKTWGLEYWKQAMIGTSNTIAPTQKKSIEVPGSYMLGMSELPINWVTNGTPNTIIASSQGSTAIDKTRVADNKYIKNQIINPSVVGSLAQSSGWELQSEAGRQILFKDTFSGITSAGYNSTSNLLLLDDANLHKPEINVFSNAWVNNNSQWYLNKSNKNAVCIGNNNAISSINIIPDCEIKLLVRLLNPSTLGNNIRCGIAFRLNNSVNPLTYWRLCFEKNNSVALTPYIRLEAIGLSSFTALNYLSIQIPNSGSFILKVILKGEYISTFFNDLILFNIKNNYNYSLSNHGIIANSNSFVLEKFITLI